MNNEFTLVEEPALIQLQSNGWTYKNGKQLSPDTSNIRSSLREVVLLTNLRKAIKRINPWISDENLGKIIRDILLIQTSSNRSKSMVLGTYYTIFFS